MERKIVRTADGSKTIQIPEWGEQYHSMHGAVQEAYHVFLHHGLYQFANRGLDLLEMGFGTGLNALITLLEAPSRHLEVRYTSLEAFPIGQGEWEALDYGKSLSRYPEAERYFEAMHRAAWEEPVSLSPWFTLTKRKMDLHQFRSGPDFDLVYFDAFGARVQPELWTEEVFASMYGVLRQGGSLVTYAAKGSVRRAMQAAGFRTERLPGPPGKREMLRAVKE